MNVPNSPNYGNVAVVDFPWSKTLPPKSINIFVDSKRFLREFAFWVDYSQESLRTGIPVWHMITDVTLPSYANALRVSEYRNARFGASSQNTQRRVRFHTRKSHRRFLSSGRPWACVIGARVDSSILLGTIM